MGSRTAISSTPTSKCCSAEPWGLDNRAYGYAAKAVWLYLTSLTLAPYGSVLPAFLMCSSRRCASIGINSSSESSVWAWCCDRCRKSCPEGFHRRLESVVFLTHATLLRQSKVGLGGRHGEGSKGYQEQHQNATRAEEPPLESAPTPGIHLLHLPLRHNG